MRRTVLLFITIAIAVAGFLGARYYTDQQGSRQGEAEIAKSDPSPAAKKGITFFKGSWEEAKERAKAEDQPIFVDAYADWCAPCKMMEKRVFTRSSVGDFYNENFVNVKFDMEKGNGPDFRENHNVSAYPTLLFFNSEGKVVHRKRGALGPDGLVRLGKQALDKVNQE
jgi:thiol:disulfide interchange protein